VAQERWQRDSDDFEDACGASRRVGAQHEAVGLLLDSDLLEAVEVAYDVGPFEIEASCGETLVEFFAQKECKK